MGRLIVGGVLVALATCATGDVRVIGMVKAAERECHPARLAEAFEGDVQIDAVVLPHPQPMLANVSDEYQVVRLWPRSDALAAARDALDQQCEAAAFHETPFREFVAAVAEKAGIRISLDQEALGAMGFDADTPITANLAGMSFRAGLREVLEDVDLACILRNDHVVITSAEKAAGIRETVFYPVLAGVDVYDVAALVEETVSPQSWSHRGGRGTISAAPAGLGRGLVISHTSETHEEIESILRGLDSAQWTPAEQDEGVTAVYVRAYVVDDDDSREGLADRLLELCNRALPHGADADARIEVIGRSIVVQSRSRPFQVMAAQIIAAIVEDDLEVEVESDEAATAVTAESDT